MSGIDFRAEAAALRDEMVARRRDLHRHPELAFEEVRTAALIANELRNLGLEVQTGVGRTGVVGILEGDQDGPTILYRADMDALPIQEENDVDYASQTPGVMHACGHDGHVTIALGVAKLLMRQRGQMAGRVKFVFQPAEETGAGARAMIDDGVLIDPAPDVTIGLHLWNPLPIGEVGIAEGAVMAGSSVFQIIIQGRGGHAAMPYTTIDPVVCASQVVMALHALVGRRFNAMEGAVVLSVTSLETSSKAYNVIPDQVEIRGTFRTFDAGVSRQLEQYICETTEALCRSMNCSVKVRVDHQTFPVVNHPEMVARLRRLFGRMIGEDRLDTKARTMAAEDVSFLMNDKPGVFFFLGSSNTDRGLNYGHHHPRFDFDEDALPLGVALMSAALADFVLNDGR
jgi:amidohydrolase